ncbi:PucR family transcriptional regulator [Mycolicibacterium thermoresistibile]
MDRLINVLGSYGVRLQFCPVPRSTEVRSVALYEHADDRVITGDVLLALGAESVSEAVRWAETTQAVVVLTRAEPDPAGPAPAGHVAVMTVEPTVSWSELAAVVYGLVLEGRETESGRGPTDLFALADTLAEAVRGAVTIEDRQSRVLAYSRLQQHADPARRETILARQAPEPLRRLFEQLGVADHLTASDEPLFIAARPDQQLTGRTVVAARAGRELLGAVWVACTEPLDEARRAALADGARTVALHLLRSRASADLERQVESDLVLRLLDGTPDAETAVVRLGLPQEALRVIAVRARAGAERQAPLLLAFERATTGFGWSRAGRSALSGDTVYTVLPADRPSTAQRWVAGLRAALPAEVTVLAGISGVASNADLPTARREADECLALYEARRDRTGADAAPVVYDESWHDVLLQRLRTAAGSGRMPSRGPIAALRDHDLQHATQYVATLRSWLASHGDPAAAGEALGVHENTVRYRLRKMTTVTTLDLQDPEKRIALMIELAAINDPPILSR